VKEESNGKANQREAEIAHKERIRPYSPKKIKIKDPPPYSKLNPLISSLSPSAKSRGARFTSDTTQKSQKKPSKE